MTSHDHHISISREITWPPYIHITHHRHPDDITWPPYIHITHHRHPDDITWPPYIHITQHHMTSRWHHMTLHNITWPRWQHTSSHTTSHDVQMTSHDITQHTPSHTSHDITTIFHNVITYVLVLVYLPHFRVALSDVVDWDSDERVEDYACVCPAVVGVFSHPFCRAGTVAEWFSWPVRSKCVWWRGVACIRGEGVVKWNENVQKNCSNLSITHQWN